MDILLVVYWNCEFVEFLMVEFRCFVDVAFYRYRVGVRGDRL